MLNMKKIILFIFISLTFFSIQNIYSNNSHAGLNDPWYACFIVSGGTLQKCMGPYNNKFECLAQRYNIPLYARWLGCKQ